MSPRQQLHEWLAGLTASRSVFLIILLGSTLRLLVGASVGLEQDGTYSVVIARQLSWGYFDHPPLHHWLVHLFGRMSEAGIVLRLPFILMFAGSTWLMFRLTAEVFGETAGVWAALAFNLSGAFSFAFSFFIAPDGPLFFFLLLFAYCLARILLVDPAPRYPLRWWMAVGLAGGGALLSKYSAVLAFAGAFLFLVTTDRWRWLATPGPWLAAALMGVLFSPVVWWNWNHDWVSFVFQGTRALPDGDGHFVHVLEMVGMQFLYLLPWVFIPLVVVLALNLARGPSHSKEWFFVCLAVVPILVFMLVNLLQRGLAHWALPGWLFVFPLLGIWIVQLGASWRASARRLAVTAAAILLTVTTVFLVEARTRAIGMLLTGLFPAQQVAVTDPAFALFDWRELRERLQERGLLNDETKFVAALSWQSTARIAYALGDGIPVLCLCNDQRHFRYLHNHRDFSGTSGLVIDFPEGFNRDWRHVTWFERTQVLPPIFLHRGGVPMLELMAHRADGFKSGR